MRFKRQGGDRKPELNLASMIDATFLLLAYFIFTSGAGMNESKLSPNLRVQQRAGRRCEDAREGPRALRARVFGRRCGLRGDGHAGRPRCGL